MTPSELLQSTSAAPDRSVDPARRAFFRGIGALVAACAMSAAPSSAAQYPYGYPPNRGGRSYPAYPAPPMRTLTQEIESYIQYLRSVGRIAPNEQTAWLVYDFTTQRYLAAINANRPFQSASMVKPLIALAFFHKVYEGRLSYTAFDRQRMEAMIQHSDNNATNYFIHLLGRTSSYSGPAEAERTLKRKHPGMFHGTRIVEAIPSGGRTYRNRSSALDYHRFLYALWHNQLPYAMELKRLMNLPNRDRMYSGAHGVARETWVIDKTGTTARLCGNMGILIAQGQDGRRYPYTFVGIIEKTRPAPNYLGWQKSRGDVIREVSNLSYGYLQRMHHLV